MTDPRAHSPESVTDWSMVLAAADRDRNAPAAREALAALCQIYWPPVYSFTRRRCRSREEAEDLTQEFFARLIARNDLAGASPERGRFRAFLFTVLSNFLANERDRAAAQKRGGDRRLLSLELRTGEEQVAWELADELTPQRLFDRQWASTLLAEVLRQLRGEYAEAGKAELFDGLKACLTDPDSRGYPQLAVQLRLSEGALRVAVHRLRRRYGKLLRRQIARTVADPAEIEAEIQFLFAAFER